MAFFLFPGAKKEIALGDKIVPIDIIDISSIPSKGEYFKEQENKAIKETQKKIKEEKKIMKRRIKKEVMKGGKTLNIKEVSKIMKEKNNISPSKNSLANQKRGIEGNLNSNELEKGSIKGKGIEKITCLSCLKPKYPKLALKRGYEGILKLKILISKNGEVGDIKIIKSSGYKILDQSGIDAAKNSKFFPLKKERMLNIEYKLKLNR
tara:strand:- start:215 stop:835 length:621 start_codon:yes stop_codon:yes gene_type:complete